jgi:hypothetical protein
MTLALACLTPEFVTLVADRRVTLGSDVLDDVATKVVVVCDRGAIAYSGLARFPMRGRRLDHWPRMDEWIVSTLSKYKVATISEAAKVLRTEATEAFKHLPGSPWQHRHAFMLVGWSVSSGNRRSPVICTVSKALDENWEWLSAAESEFRQRVFVQDDPKKFSLSSIGVSLPKHVLDHVRRVLRRGFPRNIGPQSVLRLCVLVIRSVAAVNSAVRGVCAAVQLGAWPSNAGRRWSEPKRSNFCRFQSAAGVRKLDGSTLCLWRFRVNRRGSWGAKPVTQRSEPTRA